MRPLPIGTMSVLREGADVALSRSARWSVWPARPRATQGEGIHCTVVDARFVKPLDTDIPALAARHRAVLTIEDGTAIGGFGDAVLEALAQADVTVPARRLGLPDSFIEHGAQALLLHKLGLDASGVAEAARELLRTHRPSVLAG